MNKIEESTYGNEIWLGGEGTGMIELRWDADTKNEVVWYAGGEGFDSPRHDVLRAQARLFATAELLYEACKMMLEHPFRRSSWVRARAAVDAVKDVPVEFVGDHLL